MAQTSSQNSSGLLGGNGKGVNLGMPFTALNTENFHALFDYASIGILITNSKGEIQLTNKYTERQFGYREGELVNEQVEKLIPTRYTARHEQHREKYNANPHSRPMGQGMELAGLKKSGEEFPVEVSLGHYKIGDENYAIAFIMDITQRKETEQAIVQLNAHLEQKVKEGSQSLALTVEQLGKQIKETERKDAELERVNSFLNNIWNHAGAIIVVCDKDGTIQFFNPAAEKSLGYSSEEVVGKMNLMSFHDPAELEEKAVKLSEVVGKTVSAGFEVFTVASERGIGNNMECNCIRKNGESFFASLNFTPLKDAHGEISGYLGVAIDISEKKKAEIELRVALEKEKELNELKSRFVSMASHEFRTPLSAVLSSAYLLGKYVKEDQQPQRDKHIQRIVSSVTSLTEILNDFLSVGKIEEGNIVARFADYNIKKQTEEIIQEVKHLLKRGQKISYKHTAGDTTVQLDASMMKHVITNLLSNAIKFSNEDSVVEVLTETKGEKTVVSVRDHGIGIPEDDMQDLFKRFFRSSNVTNIQGTGLGLHIVSKYAELMGGTIACESKEGEGTKFTITFINNTD